MLKSSVYILLLSLCISIISCAPDKLKEKELYGYLKDESNGLIHTWENDPFGVSVMYKPSSLLAKQELGEEKDAKKVKDVKDRYNKYAYFVLNYSYNGGELLNAFAGNRPKFSELVNQLSFGMKEQISIITDQKKKVPLADFIHSRHYGMGGGSMVLLVFNREDILSQTNKHFKIKLKDIGIGTGNLSFTIEKENIENCPILK